MDFNAKDTAIVITDPQNDFLSPQGVTWGLVGESVQENGTVEHIEQLLKAAKENGDDVFHEKAPLSQGQRGGPPC